jgi:hypothetical protein
MVFSRSSYSTAQAATARRVPFARLFPTQNIDNWTIGGRTALTTGSRLSKRPFHPAQVSDLAADYSQMVNGGFVDFAASVAAFDQAQQIADFVKSEPQLSAAANEDEPLQVIVRVKPVPAFSARRRRQKANFLVIANRLDMDARSFRYFPDSEVPCRGQKFVLDPVAATDCILLPGLIFQGEPDPCTDKMTF